MVLCCGANAIDFIKRDLDGTSLLLQADFSPGGSWTLDTLGRLLNGWARSDNGLYTRPTNGLPIELRRKRLGVKRMSSPSQPLVSVVTPAYNEEEHLAECIESVLAQTYPNWDYTIVNNYSKDNTLEIARRYAAKDPRIRVHDNERFLEMIPNHNVAVRQISPASKYCKVVLADDWIFPRCLEEMVKVAETYPSVGVVSAYEQFGQQVRIKGLPIEQNLVSGKEASRQFLLGKLLLFGSQTSVLYRADLVRSRSPFYVESEMYADFEACFALLSKSDLGFAHEILTFSRPRPGSIGAVSADLGAHYGSVIGMLFTYGKGCLTTEEFAGCLDRKLPEYYRFLGRRLLVERDPGFWFYHKRTFARLGLNYSRARVRMAAVGQLLGTVLNPKSTLASIKRLFQLKKIRNVQMRKVVSSFENERVETGDQRIRRS
jgi:glycosyltransferase involved in cell wall biosynthesis